MLSRAAREPFPFALDLLLLFGKRMFLPVAFADLPPHEDQAVAELAGVNVEGAVDRAAVPDVGVVQRVQRQRRARLGDTPVLVEQT